MVKKWIKKVLGINHLENRVNNLEREKAGLESRLIVSENEKNQIKESISNSVVSHEVSQGVGEFLENVNLMVTKQNSKPVLRVLEAKNVVEKYGLKRYSPQQEAGYSSPIISMEEFQKNPEKYFHKIRKGFFNFPIGLNFDKINEILQEKFCNIHVNTPYGRANCFSFALISLLGSLDYPTKKATELLIESTELARLRKDDCKGWIEMDNVDFLANSNGIIKYLQDFPGISNEKKARAIGAMEFVKLTYLTAMEIVGKSRIGDLSDLLKYDKEEEFQVINTEVQKYEDKTSVEQLKSKIKATLLSDIKGTTLREIEEYLPINSRERFRQLASEITSNIFSNDKERKGLTDKINKPLEEYSIGEALVLSCYFARNIITKYKTLEDSVKDVFARKFDSNVSGKCTDFTALSLHYLREYLIPMQKNKFKNWSFGVEKDTIGDYRHCYIRAIHINPDMTADVYFLDPTKLSQEGIYGLKNPDDIIKQVGMKNSPIEIKRDAEDLMIAAKENYNK